MLMRLRATPLIPLQIISVFAVCCVINLQGINAQEVPADTLPRYKFPITGTVFLDQDGDGAQAESERGMEGVAVSDGYDVVMTNANGEYVLPNRDQHAAFVFVHQPNHVKQSGQQFFHVLNDEMSAHDRFNFGLLPAAHAEGKLGAETDTLRFIQLSDVHIRNPSDRAYMTTAVNEIYEMDPPVDFIVATGDQVDWGVDAHYQNYVAGMQDPPVPYFNVFGNHELVFGPVERYHQYLGPEYYSFERGGILFLTLDCVTPSARQDTWLANTLSLLAADRPVVVFQHFPPGLEELEHFDSLGVTAVFSGHWHSEKEMEHAGVQSFNSPSFIMGGIDASPAGFKIVEMGPDGRA